MVCPNCRNDAMRAVRSCRQKCANCGYEIDCEDSGMPTE